MYKFSQTSKNENRAKTKRRKEARLARLREKYVATVDWESVVNPEHVAVMPSALETRVRAEEEQVEEEAYEGDWQEPMDLLEVNEPMNEPLQTEGQRITDMGCALQVVHALEEHGAVPRNIESVLGEVHEEEVDEERPKHACGADEISQFFVGLQATREVPKAVLSDIVSFLRRNSSDIASVLQNNELPSFKSMRSRIEKRIPPIKINVSCIDATGASVMFENRRKFPKKEIMEKNLRIQYTLYHVSLKDIRQWHIDAHPKKNSDTLSKQFDLSLDGVPESRSSGLSIEVLSVRFINCRNIYTVCILQPARKRLEKKDAIVLKPFMDEYEESGLTMRYVIADAPKRASLQGLKSHAANAGCPYCHARKEQGHYPANTYNRRRRTDEEVRKRAQDIAAGLPGDDDGVKCISLLAPIPDFDLITDVPAEAMHLVCLGVVRKMMKLMYKQVGVANKIRKYRAEFRPVSEEPLNEELRKHKGLSHFSRRPRDFDAAVYKAEEYRNLVLAYWPAVLSTCPLGTREAWLRTVYCVRGFSLPNSLYNELREKTDFGTEELRKWYIEYEAAFNVVSCSHNTHVFSHLDLVRELGPLSTTTARHYEDHYAYVKMNYKAGTISKGKQALESLLLIQGSGHSCLKRKKVGMKCTSKIDDRFVYLKDGRIIVLTKVCPGGVILGRHVRTKNAPNLLEDADLADVLVFCADPNDLGEEVAAHVRDVLGKVVFCQEFASVMTWSMLEM